MSLENEVLEVERLAVFLDGFGPCGVAEFDSARRDDDGRRLQEFIGGEVRYTSLKLANPEKAAVLFDKAEAAAKERYEYLNKLITLYGAAKE